MPTIKGKSTMLFLLRDIILKIRLKKIKKIRKTASLMFPFQFTKHTCEKLNFPKLLFYSSPQDQKVWKYSHYCFFTL